MHKHWHYYNMEFWYFPLKNGDHKICDTLIRFASEIYFKRCYHYVKSMDKANSVKKKREQNQQ